MVRMRIDRKGFGVKHVQARLPHTGNLIADKVAAEYAQYVREQWLSGQRLLVRTGTTRKSVRFFKMKNGVFGVRPGSGVPGRLNYLVKFERMGGKRAFMKPSWRAFRKSMRHRKIASDLVQRALRRTRV